MKLVSSYKTAGRKISASMKRGVCIGQCNGLQYQPQYW